ncbi:MAG: phage tail protein [Deltaproteobacteria bacterium]|nr:phage tail protein [Deltaproteobacteria bacterium]
MNLSVQVNRTQLNEVKRMFKDMKGVPEKVISRAINGTLSGVKTDTSTEARKVLNAGKKAIDKNISTNKASVSRLTGVVSIKGNIIPLSEFKPTQTQKGVTARVYKGQPRESYTSAFIATLKTGHKGVFWRTYKGKPVGRIVRRPWPLMERKYRFPIEAVYGPRLTTVVKSDSVMKPVMNNAGTRLDKNLKKEINYEMSKMGAK